MITPRQLVINRLQTLSRDLTINAEHVVMRLRSLHSREKTLDVCQLDLSRLLAFKGRHYRRSGRGHRTRRRGRLLIAKYALPMFALNDAGECERVDELQSFLFAYAADSHQLAHRHGLIESRQ